MIKITNFQYLQSIPIDLFHATIGGLVGTHEMKDPDKADTYLLNWLKADIDEGFRKGELLTYCEHMDNYNQLLAENQRLKSDNDYLVKEISKLARESIKREKALAKLEAEVMKRINENDPNQMALDECLYRQGD